MTIETTQSAQTMNGDGARRVFPFTFTAWANQLKAIITAPDGTETDVTERSSFTLEEEAGGSVTYPANTGTPALPAGWKFTVMRAMNFKQETDLVTGGQYRSEVIEDRMDRLTAQDQELLEKINRAVLVPVASGEKPPTTTELIFEIGSYTMRAESAATRAEDAADTAEQAVTGVVTQGDIQVTRVKTEGDKQVARVQIEGSRYATTARNEADRAKNEADRAAHVADQLPGFAQNAYAIFALEYGDDFRLTVKKAEPGETVVMDDYQKISVLPASCLFGTEGGRLTLHIPFTA